MYRREGEQSIVRDVERISADELAWQRTVLAQAAQLRASAQVLEQTWMAHVSQRYHLNQGDQIEDDGAIRRQPSPPPVDISQLMGSGPVGNGDAR